jgi:5-methylcytosine-specific restriction enzyme subunit McrC
LTTLTKYEYDRVTLSDEGMDQAKLDALLRFNEYHNNQYFDGIAKGIKLKQYVGIIQVDGLSIEVLPKVDRIRDNDTWREVLIQMLKATGRMKVQTNGHANVQRQHLNLLEIYFEMYLKELQYLIRSGLVKKYRKETSNVKALKGKLEFAGNIRKNLIHKERFYTTHQVYDVDHKIHQALGVALDIVSHFSKGTRLSDMCRRVQLDFPDVKRIGVNEQVLSSIRLDRKTAGYEKALEIARLIILNYSPDIKSGKEQMLSLLFDMNILWEEYVLAMLKKECKGTDIKVKGQDSKRFWGSYKTIRPDIVLEKGEETYIIDTKWKRPTNKQPSVEDLRQMYTYSRFWDTEKVMLLYPGDPIDSKFVSYRNQEIDQRDHQCKLAFVSVLDDRRLDATIGQQVLQEMML